MLKPIELNTLALALALALALTGGGAARAAEPIKIGMPVGLSGANSVVAPGVVQSAQLAVDEINAAGGVLGRQLRLEIADDGSGAVGAQKAFDSLVFRKQVDVIISMETSAARNAGLPIVNKGKIPYIYTSFYEGHACSPWLFVNAWVPEQQVPPVVHYFMRELKAKSFFLVGSDYAFGRGMLAFARQFIEREGGKVVGEEYLPMDATDWTAVLSKLRATGADALITSTAGGAPNVSLTKQLRAAGLKLPYGNLAVDEGTAKSLGADGQGLYISASYVTGIDSPENQRYLAAMGKKYGAALKVPNDLSVPQYEAIYLYKAAVEKAGGTAPEKVRLALPEVAYDGPRGRVRMSKQHHAPLKMYLGQAQADGAIKVVQSFNSISPGEQCPAN